MDGVSDRVTLREITAENWRAALRLSVRPDQQRFVAEYAPVVAIALAKAYLRVGGLTWAPYAIYRNETADETAMVGFVALAYTPGSADDYWIFHLFIDQLRQGRGYGAAALRALLELAASEHPACRTLRLTLHPDNSAARRLYTAAGFRPTGTLRWDEPVYQLVLHETP